ncbi:MAG: ATP-binding protein [Candidatus Hydrogenedentes bacterium]|nr:ATP-binding protein [Candidatus Hydrogenedentota bacterium]
MTNDVARILVVDDELGMREGCSKVLSMEGFDVETAADGLAGLKLFWERGDFAVALVDLKMPGMGGLELIEHLRRQDEDVAIFVITAYAAIDTAVEATRRGAYGYIPKPFTPDELLIPVRNGLERRSLNIEAKRLRAERERRLLELARERSKSSTIINCMADGVIVVNRDRQIVLRNAAATRILPGFEQVPLSSPLDRLDCQELQALIADALKEPAGPVIASKELHIDKSVYMANVSPVLEPNGESAGAVAVLRDISALKKLETAKSMFISMVAHEVKSPLAAIEGQLMTVLSGAAKSDHDHETALLERALLRAKNLRSMVNDLLNLTAMETGNFTIKRLPINALEVVQAAVDANREKAKDLSIELKLEAPPAPGHSHILADRDSIFLILMNLIDNAIKYTRPNGHVFVSVCDSAGFVKIAVKDDGIGMTQEQVDSAFDEFYRAKNEYTVHIPGTGLGLTLVKRLTELHQGSIKIQSQPQQGSTFTLTLPTIN